MSCLQIALIIVAALVVFVYVRRTMLIRSVKQYSPEEVSDRRRDVNVILLDVRSQSERSSQYIKGSLHIPLQELRRKVDDLKRHRSQEIICYCQGGNRSLIAAGMLRKLGYNAANMKGGIGDWNTQNLKS